MATSKSELSGDIFVWWVEKTLEYPSKKLFMRKNLSFAYEFMLSIYGENLTEISNVWKSHLACICSYNHLNIFFSHIIVFRDMMVLQMYFQSFDFETLIISQESFINFLCKYYISIFSWTISVTFSLLVVALIWTTSGPYYLKLCTRGSDFLQAAKLEKSKANEGKFIKQASS